MRIGIDFGTTRIVAAVADRGNYPLISFESGDTAFEWFPPLVAIREAAGGPEFLYGWEAWRAQGDPDWTVIRSLKRYLEDAGPHTVVRAAGLEIPLSEILVGLTSALRDAIRASRPDHATEPLEIMLGVPAHANSNQRFLTVDAFRRGGFQVLGLLNEPSAASIEFGHRVQTRKTAHRVLVYDLGGGTFDASLVELGADTNTVLGTEGISGLGGDDFDHLLAGLAFGEDRLHRLTLVELFRLEEECRRQKESLHPNSRRVVVDLDVVAEGLGQTTVLVSEFYERCRPLVEQTVRAASMLASRGDIDYLYVTGGGSELPIVARVLREEFGRKVKRSEYTRSATAIGLAIQADASSGFTLNEVFTRHFGVWREREAGRVMTFDPIFSQGTRLPSSSGKCLEVTRLYTPVHNIGHFRYLEASALLDDGEPSGDISVWDEIQFPFDPSLAGSVDLGRLPIGPSDAAPAQMIEERYSCDATGAVAVRIRNLTSGYDREYKLGHWSGGNGVVQPGARRAATAKARDLPA